MKTVIHRTRLYFDAARTFIGKGHCFLKYEDFVKYRAPIFVAIRDLTGLRVGAADRAAIVEKYSVEANRQRAARMKDFNEIGEYEIHGDHIGPVAHGAWRSAFPPWAVRMIDDGCAQMAKEWRYE